MTSCPPRSCEHDISGLSSKSAACLLHRDIQQQCRNSSSVKELYPPRILWTKMKEPHFFVCIWFNSPAVTSFRHVHLPHANTLSSANISQRLCHHITLHIAHNAMITHCALSGSDVIEAVTENANIPRGTGDVLWWRSFLLSDWDCSWTKGH